MNDHGHYIGDPHNTKRGYFFAHMGWLLRKKHPALVLKQQLIDLSDTNADPVALFHF